jgi:aspartyl-tRNA(Asn)/glutamyl-tRNA(Gln) amidotransferase subunit A
MDHAGPIARTVEDLAILLEGIVSPLHQMAWRAAHPSVPSSAMGFAVWSGSARSPASPFPLPDAVHLGRLRGLFADRSEPAALAVFETALDRISASGAQVSDVALPAEFDDVLACHRVIITFEAALQHRPLFAKHAGDYLPCIRGLIEEGMSVTPDEYARCKLHPEALTRDVAAAIAGVDVLVCPATVGPAPARDTTGDPAFNAPWSYTGLPSVSFPVGLSPDGLPLSMQLVGRPHDEATLFGVAQWCERQVHPASS